MATRTKMTQFRRIQRVLLYPFDCVSTRFMMGVLGFFGFINLYMTRVNLSMIVVAMVKRTHSREAYCGSNINDELCSSSNNSSNSTGDTVTTGEIEWDEATIGTVMSFFFYGYALTQVWGGRLAEVWGTKWVFGTAILSSGLLTLLTPLIVVVHPAAMCALRFTMGLCQGVSRPSMHAMLVRWIPLQQRQRFVSIVYIATTLGTVITMPLCGAVIEGWGWRAAFYVTGALSVTWALFWWMMIFDKPEDHVRIKPSELKFITDNIRSTGTSAGAVRKVPWRAIFTSPPFLVIFLADCGNNFGLQLFTTQIPNYISQVYSLSIRDNSMLSAAPFLARYIGSVLFGCLGDAIVSRKLLSVVVVRKTFSVFAMFCPAILLVIIILYCESLSSVIYLMSTAMFLNGAIASSVIVNHSDIAPNYAGTLYGITNMAASLAGGAAPLIAGFIVTNKTREEWQTVFWTCIPFYAVTEVFFLAFASGSVQDWNYYDTEPEQTHDRHELSETGKPVTK